MSPFWVGVNIFFRKKEFPDSHLGHNKEMKKRGIVCAKTMDRIEAVLKQMTSPLENADLVFDLASKLLTEADPKMVLDNYKATIYGTV